MYNTDKIDYNDYMFKQIYTSVIGGLASKLPTNSKIDEHQLVGVAMTLTQKAYGALQDKIEWQDLRKKFDQPVYHASPEYGNYKQSNLSSEIEPGFWNTKSNFYPYGYGQSSGLFASDWGSPSLNNTTAFTGISAKPNTNDRVSLKVDEDAKRQLDKLIEDLNKTMLNIPSSYNFEPYKFSAYTAPTSESVGKEASCTLDEFRAKTTTQPLSAFYKDSTNSKSDFTNNNSHFEMIKSMQETIDKLVNKIDQTFINNQDTFTSKSVPLKNNKNRS